VVVALLLWDVTIRTIKSPGFKFAGLATDKLVLEPAAVLSSAVWIIGVICACTEAEINKKRRNEANLNKDAKSFDLNIPLEYSVF
jgi:hypothetical protein